MDIFMKIWEKMKWKSSVTISLFNFDYLSDEDGKKLMSKMKMSMKKFEKMNLIFEFSISKLSYVTIFMKIWEEKDLTLFLRHFWPIKTKMKMEIKNYGKISLIYEFSISKLGYTEIFMKIWEKFFEKKSFLTIRGKNEDEDEKIWGNDFNFWILHIKIRLNGIFHKNLRKNFFFGIFTCEGHTRINCRKG